MIDSSKDDIKEKVDFKTACTAAMQQFTNLVKIVSPSNQSSILLLKENSITKDQLQQQ